MHLLSNFFWVIAAVVAGIFFFSGFKMGGARSLILLAGLLFSALVGLIIGTLVGLIFGGLLPCPALWTGMAAGYVVMIFTFTMVVVYTSIGEGLFEEFADELFRNVSSLRFRFLFAMAGGVFQLLFLALLSLGVYGTMEALGLGGLEAQAKPGLDQVAAGADVAATDLQKGAAVATNAATALAAKTIAGPIAKLVKVYHDPKAMNRLKKYPDLVKLMNDPLIQGMMINGGVNDAVAKNDGLALAANPLVIIVAANSALVVDLVQPNVEKELDEVLAPDTTSPKTGKTDKP